MRSRGLTSLAPLGASFLAVTALTVGCASQPAKHRSKPGVGLVAGMSDPVRAAQKTLSAELRSQHLSVQYVDCVRNGRFYRGRPIIRCNVNFGDPHVVAYCSVVLADRLVTSQQDPLIPCRPDTAGSRPLLFPASP